MSVRLSPVQRLFDVLMYLFLIIAAVAIVLPLAFMITASAMPAADILTMPYRWIPRGFHVENFVRAIRGNDGSFIFLRNLVNSIVVAVTVTFTTVVLSAFTGYGLAKFHFRGRNFVFMLIMATMMIPFEAIMVPLYLVATRIGMQNTYPGLIVPFAVNAFGVFLMRQFLLVFPDELLDATRIDGAGELQICFRVVFPNSVPAMATLAVITFRSQWDNLLWPLLVAQSEKMKTVPLYIVKFAVEKYTDEGAMMAVALLASLPIMVLFLTMSQYFLGGSTVYSAQKG